MALASKGGAGSSAALQEALQQYTVTAVLGDVAVLRTNVGGSTMPPPVSGGTNNQGSGSNAADRGRQQVLRVRSGQMVTIGGVSVVPLVTAAQVDFTLPGKHLVVFTAPLESLTPHQYALPSTLKEAADPGMAARVLPAATGTPSGSMQTGGTGAGATPYAPSAAGPR